MSSGRRVTSKGASTLNLPNRTYMDVRQELQELLEELEDSNDDGIPPGFNSVDPQEIQAGVSADPGTENEGWAAADHVHSVSTGTPVAVGEANSEGTSSELARADHVHDASDLLYLALVM